MDATTIASSAAVGLLLVALLVVVGRTRRRTRRLLDRARVAERGITAALADTAAAEQRGASARIGEREAAWSTRTAMARALRLADRAEELRDRLADAERTAAAAETASDELRDVLRRAEADRVDADRARRAAEDRVTSLETEAAEAARALRAVRADVAGLRAANSPQHLAELTEAAALRERIAALEIALDAARNGHERGGLPANPWDPPADDEAARIARLEDELEESQRDLEAARARLAAAPDPAAAEEAAGLQARLTAREAELRELEQRLATLSAARHAEITRLNERIAAMERLYGEVEQRDHRITDLEAALAEAGEEMDRVRLEVGTLRSDLAEAHRQIDGGAARSRDAEQALAAAQERIHDLETAVSGSRDSEIRQLRELLAGERERNARLARRDGSTPDVERAVSAAVAPLQAEIARLQAGLHPSAAPPPTDVTLIKGIGPVIARILADHGITTLKQVAAMTDAEIDHIGPALPVYPGRVRDDAWVEQARRLLGGG